MCTSIYTKAKDGSYLLSRTMDFSLPLEPSPIFLPREYQWNSLVSLVNEKEVSNKYGFIGAGRFLGTGYFVADGVNEHGLAAAELYLPGNAIYQEYSNQDKKNLAPHELIMWILGNFKTIDELAKEITNVCIVEEKVPVLDIVTPLHWIITDQSGRCVVIEPTEAELRIKENLVGVMTNSPNIEWHIQNLRNYLNARPKQYDSAYFGEFEATPFSQGTGTSGLPGGFTPPERFIRAAFFKQHINMPNDEEENVNNAYHILNTVRIPKGIVVTTQDTEDYSLYVGSMCNTSKTYYFTTYENHRIVKLVLTDELLAEKEAKVFEYKSKTEPFLDLNAASKKK